MICQNSCKNETPKHVLSRPILDNRSFCALYLRGRFILTDPILSFFAKKGLFWRETVIFYPNNYYPFEDSKKNASSFSCVIRASFFALNKAIFTRCGGELLKFYNTPLCWLLSPTLLLPQSRVPIWGLDKQFFLGWILTYFDSRASRWRILAFF